MRLNMTFNLIKHELMDFFKQPPLLMLVGLPILMSTMIVSFMNEPGMDLALVPSWILFAQVMVGLMIIAPGFIEEKEQKTLDALLVSPLSFQEVIVAKSVTVLFFSLISQLFVYILNLEISMELLTVFLFMMIGGILFIGIGLIIGLLLNSSKSSTALSSVIMVVMFITASFYQQLPEWSSVTQFIPSVVVVENINAVFNETFSLFDLGLLAFWFILILVIIQLLVKRELTK